MQRHFCGSLNADFVTRLASTDRIQATNDDRKKIVEVVGDAAGELADGLHFLGLAKRLFRLPTLGHLFSNAIFKMQIQLLQLSFRGLSLGNLLAQFLLRLAERVLGGFARRDVDGCSDRANATLAVEQALALRRHPADDLILFADRAIFHVVDGAALRIQS